MPTITSWDWDWGDGTAHGTTQNPYHEYTDSGIYNVVLTVEDDNGDSATTSYLFMVHGYDIMEYPQTCPLNLTYMDHPAFVLDDYSDKNGIYVEDNKLILPPIMSAANYFRTKEVSPDGMHYAYNARWKNDSGSSSTGLEMRFCVEVQSVTQGWQKIGGYYWSDMNWTKGYPKCALYKTNPDLYYDEYIGHFDLTTISINAHALFGHVKANGKYDLTVRYQVYDISVGESLIVDQTQVLIDAPHTSAEKARVYCTAPYGGEYFHVTKDVLVSSALTHPCEGPLPNIISWDWDFGDGSAHGTTKSPTHVYTDYGLFNVTLTVEDMEGDTASITSSAMIFVPGVPAVEFDWDFGDGHTSEGEAVEHIFDYGFYNVTHEVKNGFGDSADICYVGIIANYDESSIVVQWDFGDGKYSDQLEPTNIYENYGEYLASVTLSLPDESDMWSETIIVFGIWAIPTYGPNPLTCTFYVFAPATAWIWRFGDAKTSRSSSPIHTYQSPGKFTIRLRVLVEGEYYEIIKEDYITVWPGGVIVSRTTKCFRFAVLPEQGIAFSENCGDDWIFPETGEGPELIFDENDQPQLIVTDNNDGFDYNLLLRDGPENSGLVKYFKDKVDVDGTGGTNVSTLVRFCEDEGTYENYWLRHILSHIFVRPVDEMKRNATGYDANGLPTGLELTLKIYKDGEPSTAERTVSNIPITGDVQFDENVEAHRLALEVTGNMGAHALVGRKQSYVTTDRPTGSGVMTEDDYQEEFALPSMWFSREPNLYTDRATGQELSAAQQAKIAATAGPDDRSDSAMQITEAITLPSVTLVSGAVLLWYQGTIALTIGGVSVTLTDHGTSGSWKLAYASAVTKSGAVVITPTGTAKLFDIRMYNSAISAGARGYYFDNVDVHDGDVMLP